METPTPAALLMLARELRDAAVIAGRADVAAQAEEAIALLTSSNGSAGTTQPTTGSDKSNTVIRILDGLGL